MVRANQATVGCVWLIGTLSTANRDGNGDFETEKRVGRERSRGTRLQIFKQTSNRTATSVKCAAGVYEAFERNVLAKRGHEHASHKPCQENNL